MGFVAASTPRPGPARRRLVRHWPGSKSPCSRCPAVYGTGEPVAEGVDVAPTEGVTATDGVAVGERVWCGVPVGDAERVGVDVAAGGAVVRVGSVEVDCCTVDEELPPVAVGLGLKSP